MEWGYVGWSGVEWGGGRVGATVEWGYVGLSGVKVGWR